VSWLTLRKELRRGRRSSWSDRGAPGGPRRGRNDGNGLQSAAAVAAVN